MTIAVMGMTCRTQPIFRQPIVYCVSKAKRYSSVAFESPTEPWIFNSKKAHPTVVSNDEDKREGKAPEWKKINSKDLGLKTSLISSPAKFVLKELKRKGYAVYLVGGCVRDLIMKKTPKDFDIITSAELLEIVKTFPRAFIVGRRFPICQIHVKDTIVEVSSFTTSAQKFRKSRYVFREPSGCDELDFIRLKNCLQRDFTVNGFMFDPYTKLVYDYLDGMKDVRNTKIRTIIPAEVSFREDCARILRAVRIAARLGFRISKEIVRSIKLLSPSLMILNQARIFMEMNYMLSYGSAEGSLRLLWRFGLLELFLPFQAAYLVSTGFQRRDQRSNMLFSLFSNLDRLVTPDKPCHSSVWVAMLAFHKALDTKPRDPLVISAFSLAVHNSGSLLESMKIARSVRRSHDNNFRELLLESAPVTDQELISEVLDLAVSVRNALSQISDRYSISRAMKKYPNAPRPHFGCISNALASKVYEIFECIRPSKGYGLVTVRGNWIDYDLLASGCVFEIRHMFARIVFDTVYPFSNEEKLH